MNAERSPITQPQKLTINESQLKQVITPRYWENLALKKEREKLKQATIEKLEPDIVERINNQIQEALMNQSRIVYKTDIHTHVLDAEKNVYYSLNPNSLTIAKLNPFKSIEATVYQGHLDAKLTLSEYLAFFNIQVNGNDFVHRFYHQDINTVPLIFSVSKNSAYSKLILAQNPYKKNSMILGAETI